MPQTGSTPALAASGVGRPGFEKGDIPQLVQQGGGVSVRWRTQARWVRWATDRHARRGLGAARAECGATRRRAAGEAEMNAARIGSPTLRLALVLPGVLDECDACVARLTTLLPVAA